MARPFGTERADRNAKALARLDEPERMQWQQFWLAVDAALKKALTPP
jgi:hypothetical protein